MSTKGAMKAAEIIMAGKRIIRTDYGEKRIDGIADLIDRETGAPDLAAALKRYFSEMEIGDVEQRDMVGFERMARAALMKAEGGA